MKYLSTLGLSLITSFCALTAVTPASATLGSLGNDLVFTPVAPCRIIDTRSTVAGAIAANSTRNFVAFNVNNFTGQGGSATNCGTNPLNATAVAVNVTAVTPAAAGFATIYPFSTTQPLASSINYAAGAVVNNALIVQTPNPEATFDFTIYTSAQSHYVADFVGYFAPPVATALQCVDVASTGAVTLPASGTAAISSGSCAAGYTISGGSCLGSSSNANLVTSRIGVGGGNYYFCAYQNSSATATTVDAIARCCRVPGR